MLFRLFRSKRVRSSRGAGVTASAWSTRSRHQALRRRYRSAVDDELMSFIAARKRGALGLYEDRRKWNPAPKPAKGAVSVSHRLIAVPNKRGIFEEHKEKRRPMERVGFYRPWRVIICARRKMRKEVLHAKFRPGSGGGSIPTYRKPRYNEFSQIVCYGG